MRWKSQGCDDQEANKSNAPSATRCHRWQQRLNLQQGNSLTGRVGSGQTTTYAILSQRYREIEGIHVSYAIRTGVYIAITYCEVRNALMAFIIKKETSVV